MRAIVGATLAAWFVCVPSLALDEINVFRGDSPNSCTASYVKNIFSTGGLSVMIEQRQYVIAFMLPGVAPQIPKGKYQGAVAFDSQPPFTIDLEGEGGTYAGYLSQSQWFALRTTQTVTLTVEGKSFAFPADRMTEVMDAAAQCAGAPTVAQIREAKTKIVNAVGASWIIRPDGNANGVCHGTRMGIEVDSFVTERADGRFEFGVAEMSWHLEPGKVVAATIEIDQDPLRSVQVATSRQTANIIADADLQKRLETAEVVVWHLPWGTFRSEVNGVPELRQKLADCLKTAKH